VICAHCASWTCYMLWPVLMSRGRPGKALWPLLKAWMSKRQIVHLCPMATMCPKPGCSMSYAVQAGLSHCTTLTWQFAACVVVFLFCKTSMQRHKRKPSSSVPWDCCWPLAELLCLPPQAVLHHVNDTIIVELLSTMAGADIYNHVLCRGWKKKQGRSMSNLSPTDSISCPHGALLPAALGPRAKRAIVPPPLWDYFKDSWKWAEKQRQLQQAPDSSVPAPAAHTTQ